MRIMLIIALSVISGVIVAVVIIVSVVNINALVIIAILIIERDALKRNLELLTQSTMTLNRTSKISI